MAKTEIKHYQSIRNKRKRPSMLDTEKRLIESLNTNFPKNKIFTLELYHPSQESLQVL